MQRLAIQNTLKCTGTLQIFIDPHWYSILDTGLILRSIELFIYIQTNVCVNVNAYACHFKSFFFFSDEEEKMESLKPKLLFNPHFQRLYQVSYIQSNLS
jgi:hypothetical protein